MKFWVGVLVIIALIFYFFFPLVNRERQCYVISQESLDQISSNVLNQKLTSDMECSQTTDTLFTLESCMQDATASSIVAQYANGTIQNIVAIIRPYAKNLWTLKEEHNAACATSGIYQLP